MKKKRIVIALGHEALGSTLPEQQKAAARTAKAVADFIREDYQVVITHSNGPQVGMIHTNQKVVFLVVAVQQLTGSLAGAIDSMLGQFAASRRIYRIADLLGAGGC